METNPDLPPSPVGNFERFMFSTASMSVALSETETLVARYESQIDDLNRECTVGGFPIIEGVLRYSRDKNELKQLAAGLAKVANLVTILDDLLVRKQTLELAKKDPNFFAFAFGDFSDDADRLVEHLTNMLKEHES